MVIVWRKAAIAMNGSSVLANEPPFEPSSVEEAIRTPKLAQSLDAQTTAAFVKSKVSGGNEQPKCAIGKIL